MKFKAYTIIQRAVEQGVGFGFAHAIKHQDLDPELVDRLELLVKEHMEREVMDALEEVIDFGDV